MYIDDVRCPSCDGSGYRGPLGMTCSRCEGSGVADVIVREDGDCRRCDGFGKVAMLNTNVPCPANCGSTGYTQVLG